MVTKVAKSCHTLPKAVKSCNNLSKVATGCHKLPKVAKSYQKLSKAATGCQKLPEVARSCHKLSKVLLTFIDILLTSTDSLLISTDSLLTLYSRITVNVDIVSSDRSSCSDDGLLYIYPATFPDFEHLCLSKLLQVSL